MSEEPTITVSEGGFELPVVEVLTGRGVVFGKSGSGKSNSVGVIAEELLEQGFPLCIVDADGEHYGLKEEYELLHVGGDPEVDVQIGPEHAEQLASVMLDEDVPVILDISGFIDESDAHELVERVISRLFSMEKKAKKPFPVFIEEAHEVVPETNHPDSTAKTIIKAAKRGRKHGLGVVAASQRPAEVKKSFATQSSWSVWHKLEWKQDTDVVKEVINREYAEAVQDLDTGEAIIKADWMDDVRVVQFRRKHTFDAGATPGLDEFTTPELKGVSEQIIDQLQSVTEEQAAEDEEVDQLREEVERLRAERDQLERELEQVGSGGDSGADPEKVKTLSNRLESVREERDQLETAVAEYESELADAESTIGEQRDRIESLERDVSSLRDRIETARGALGADVDSEVSEMRDRIEQLEAENERLREQAGQGGGSVIPENADYLDFVQHDAVQDALDKAKEEDRRPGYLGDILAAIIDENGAVTYDEIAKRKGVSTTGNIGTAATTLESFGIVEKTKVDGKTAVDLNVEGVQEIIENLKKRERAEEIKESYL